MVLDKIFGFLKTIKQHYVDHDIEYQKIGVDEETGEEEYLIMIGIKLKGINEEQIKTVMPMLNNFLKGLLKEGKIKVPVNKELKEKMKKLSRIKLRLQGKDIANF